MTRNEKLYRIAAAIENGSKSGFFPMTAEQAEQKARQVLDATEWKSLAAATRYMRSKRIANSL